MIATTHQTERIKLHYNLPQLYFSLIFAQINCMIWGRRTGKTEGPGAIFSAKNIHDMPRSNGVILGTTYTQLMGLTLQGLRHGWEKLGYHENVHYWVGRYAPDKLKLPKAYKHPDSPYHYIHWYNGSGIFLVSQDRPGLINGVEAQWHFIDEAKNINKKRMDQDMIPTRTGLADLYGHLSNYLSILYCTDMPTTSSGKWLLEYEKQMDRKTIETILAVHIKIIGLQEKYHEASNTSRKKIVPELRKLYDYLNALRSDTVYFSMASTLDNIHALGIEPFKQFKRHLSDLDFRVSVLNKQIMKIENGFYGLLDPDVHGKYAENYSYYETLSLKERNPENRDCRWDSDINSNQALDIACDYNNAINSIVTGQENNNIFTLLSSKFVLHPLMLNDCVKQWHEYYSYHKTKDVNYYYDSTAIKGNARSDISDADEWTNELTKLGWNVNRIDIGQIGSHKSRFFFWGRLLQGADPRLPKFLYNKVNCASWEISAQQAGIIRTQDKIKKDKRSESPDSGIPPNEATHLSEAADVLLWGKYRDRFGDDLDFINFIHN